LDDRLIGKVLRRENSGVELKKLAAAPSFMQDLSSAATVVATVRVAQPDYVPAGVNLRTRISRNLFTASMSKQELMAILNDAAVEVVQPSQIIHLGAKTTL
jgi:hypothetical protein